MKKNIKGFTLLELLTVIIIVGILGALALPNYMRAQRRSYSAEAWVNTSAVLEAMKIYYVDNSYNWTTSITALPVDNPNSMLNRKFDYSVAFGGVGSNPGTFVVWADGRSITGSGSMVYGLLCTNCMAAGEAVTRWECDPFPGCVQVGG